MAQMKATIPEGTTRRREAPRRMRIFAGVFNDESTR